MTEFFVAEIAPPAAVSDEPSWAVQEFAAMDAEDSAETIGLPDFSATAAVVQARLADQSNTARIHLLALLGDTPDWPIGQRGLPLVSASAYQAPEPLPVVGRGSADLPLRDNTNTAYSVDVIVRQGHRRRGIGSSLLRKLEELAGTEGRATMVGNSWQRHETQIDTDEAIRPSDGDIALDRRLPAHQLRLKHGYSLDQIERLSMCPLPVPEIEVPLPAGYEICVLPNGFPSSLYSELAQLMVGMSGDVPTGARPSETQVWDAERVAATFAQAAAAGMAEIAAAAKSKETGELVAYTNVSYNPDRPIIAHHVDTYVARGHRGHGLGLAIKMACYRALKDAFPEVRYVSTWNAAENEHMWAINRTLGFRQVGVGGVWHKQLAAEVTDDDPLSSAR